MYVCVCKAVTDRQVYAAVDDGATTLRALRSATGLGSGCGKCVRQAYTLVRARQDAAFAADQSQMRIRREIVQ